MSLFVDLGTITKDKLKQEKRTVNIKHTLLSCSPETDF